MEKIRVVLADDNLSVLRLLTDYFAGTPDIELVKAVSDGAQVVDAVRALRPDVLVTDIIMPRRDGFRILEELGELPEQERPRVIVLTGLSRDDLILRAVKLGASYYMVKPFDARLLACRIREVAASFEDAVIPASTSSRESAGRDVDEQVTNLFLTIGIPAHIKGYHYLREAVRMVLAEPDVMSRITKELYPGIARKFDTTASKVERAMRHAIDVASSARSAGTRSTACTATRCFPRTTSPPTASSSPSSPTRCRPKRAPEFRKNLHAPPLPTRAGHRIIFGQSRSDHFSPGGIASAGHHNSVHAQAWRFVGVAFRAAHFCCVFEGSTGGVFLSTTIS